MRKLPRSRSSLGLEQLKLQGRKDCETRVRQRRINDWMQFAAIGLCLIACSLSLAGCAKMRVLSPRAITAEKFILSEQLRDGSQQVQRGKPRKVLDAAGWVIGIPDKLLLWNRRIDNHNIGQRTEDVISEYLTVNGLDTTRVRLNQYAPRDDWRRLVQNKRVGAPWRYTFGALATLGETIFPGRLIGGDHYNPFTDTIHLYSDVPAIALHEAGHAKDFARRRYKGTYAAVYLLPFVPLVHESIATGDALAYSQIYLTPAERREAYNVLYPAYGTYVGSAFGTAAPPIATPLYYGSVIGGHIWGRSLSSQIPDETSMPRVGEYQPPLNLESQDFKPGGE